MRHLKDNRLKRIFFKVILIQFAFFSWQCTSSKKGLNVIDDFSKDSRSDYVTNIETDVFELPNNNWRISENRFYPAPETPENLWVNNEETKRSSTLFRKNERLKPGQAISITMGFVKNSNRHTKIGFMLEETAFYIIPGYVLSLEGKQYNLEVKSIENDETTLTLVRGKNDYGNMIYWHISGAGILTKGEFEIKDLPVDARFGFGFTMGWKEQQNLVYFTNFKYGNLDVKDLVDAPEAKLTYESMLPKAGTNTAKPYMESKEGLLTEKELASLVEWSLNEPGQFTNQGNRMLKGHRRMHRVYKVYDKTKDIRILNHLIEVADLALAGRNDRNKVLGSVKLLTGKEDGKWIGEELPAWPHYMGYHIQDGEKFYYGDAGNKIVGVNYIALAARAIAENPAVWNKTIDGSSYLDKAKLYVKESIYTIEKAVIPLFVEPGTLELKYQFQRYEDKTHVLNKGGYVPFNRVWHVPLAFESLCQAMEILNIDVEKTKTYDNITHTAIKRWLKSMHHYEKEGYQLIDYPYCYPSRRTYNEDPSKWDFMPDDFVGGRSEDLGHMGNDLSQLFVFYFSERYEIPEDIMRKFANSVYVNFYPKEGWFFPKLLDGSAIRVVPGALPRSAYFLTLFQPKLEPVFWDNPNKVEDDLKLEVLFLKLMTQIN